MKLFSELRQSKQKENGGVWVEWEGVGLKIARFGNAKCVAWVEAEAERLKEEKAEGKPAEGLYWPRLVANCLLLDWKDVGFEEGKPASYDPQEAETLLSDPGFSDLLDFLLTKSRERQLFLEKEEAQQTKN